MCIDGVLVLILAVIVTVAVLMTRCISKAMGWR